MPNNDSPVQPLPAIFIGKESINNRVNNYLSNKHPLLRNAQKAISDEREETKTIWYSREHIETWLNEMNLLNADGMRIYFGAYGEEDTDVAGQLCLLMVLTRTAENSTTHDDIIYENEPDFADRSAETNSRSINEDGLEGEGNPKEFNYGSPCPPICRDQNPSFPEESVN